MDIDLYENVTAPWMFEISLVADGIQRGKRAMISGGRGNYLFIIFVALSPFEYSTCMSYSILL